MNSNLDHKPNNAGVEFNTRTNSQTLYGENLMNKINFLCLYFIYKKEY